MPDDANLTAMRTYYERGEEEARLAVSAVGLLEFERTKQIVLRQLPPPAAQLQRARGAGVGPHLLATTHA